MTLARGLVSYVPLAAAAAILVATAPADVSLSFWAIFGLLSIVPTLWYLGGGALADHFISRFGALATLLAHAVGNVISFVLVLIGLYVGAIIGDQGLGGPFAFLWVLVVPVFTVVAFVLAWLVPGSFPRGRGLALDGTRLAWRWLRSVMRHITASARSVRH